MVVVIIAGSGLLIGIAAFALLWPLIQERHGVPEVAIAGEADLVSDPLVELMAQRDSVYQALRELRFDHQVGKVSDADYKVFDTQLKSQAVSVLKEIDTLKKAEADPELDAQIEAEIAALRYDSQRMLDTLVAQPGSNVPVNFCPTCGTKVRADDRFCGKCGATLTLPASQG